MKVFLTHWTLDPVGAIEQAASNCYDSTPKRGKLLDACYASGHHSVLEFADFTFHVEGVSRALSHQLVRHRLASYAQRSQRYCDESDLKYVTPQTITRNGAAEQVYQKAMEEIQGGYQKLVALGIPKEDARFLLPNACETIIEVKMNLRTLIHFMNERLCSRAQWEIRELAEKMRHEVCVLYPELGKYMVPKCEAHPELYFCTEKKPCGRHPKLTDLLDRRDESKANDSDK